jgi:hypothetical protein
MTMGYAKYTYWVTTDERKEIVVRLRSEGRRVKPARSVMCTPLDAFVAASYIAPKVWDKTCRRQGSWYRSSRFRGQELLVMDKPLAGFDERINTIVTFSDFTPPEYADRQQLEALVRSRAYQQAKPHQWEDVPEAEKRRWRRWLARNGLEMPFDDLFLIHEANHANFLDPLLYVGDNGVKVPYSVAPSTQLCSCCVEIYNIVGRRYPRKLVAPCLGALMFADLPADRYLEVTTPAAAHEESRFVIPAWFKRESIGLRFLRICHSCMLPAGIHKGLSFPQDLSGNP